MTTPRTIAITVNPFAGSGRAVQLTNRIIEILQQRNIPHQCFKDEWPAAFNDFTDLWIVGGDGTLNYFINRYPDIQLPLVIFPGGSGNDFHWMLYGNRKFDELILTALEAIPRSVDAASCNGSLFLNCAGAGFDGVVVKTIRGKNKSKGKGSFFIGVLKNIFTYKEKKYQVTGDGVNLEGEFLIVSIMNGKRAGGGFYIAPDADIKDGLLDITLIKKLGVLKRLRYLPVIEKGKHAGLSILHQFRTSNLTVSCDQPMDAQLDGEYYSSRQIEIKLLPAKFRFRY